MSNRRLTCYLFNLVMLYHEACQLCWSLGITSSVTRTFLPQRILHESLSRFRENYNILRKNRLKLGSKTIPTRSERVPEDIQCMWTCKPFRVLAVLRTSWPTPIRTRMKWKWRSQMRNPAGKKLAGKWSGLQVVVCSHSRCHVVENLRCPVPENSHRKNSTNW